MKIWVDADATPGTVKDIIFRASEKRKIETIVVANKGMRIPKSGFIRFQLVVCLAHGFRKTIASHHIPLHLNGAGIGMTNIDINRRVCGFKIRRFR